MTKSAATEINDAKTEAQAGVKQITTWLIRNDRAPRKMRRHGNTMRTIVGYDTMLNAAVDAYRLDDAIKVEVLGPYERPASRVAWFGTGLVIATVMIGAYRPSQPYVIAVMIATFTAVLTIISKSLKPPMVMARINFVNADPRLIAYLADEENDIRSSMPLVCWADNNSTCHDVDLTREEKRQADALRIGAVLSASAISMITLLRTPVTFDPTSPGFIAVVIGSLAAMVFCIIAFYQLVRVYLSK